MTTNTPYTFLSLRISPFCAVVGVEALLSALLTNNSRSENKINVRLDVYLVVGAATAQKLIGTPTA